MILYGTVTDVFPPGSPGNLNKFCYEYSVLATSGLRAQLPLAHVTIADDFGAPDEYDDRVLERGQKVIVTCLDDWSAPIIIGSIRNTVRKQPAEHAWVRRYSKIEQKVSGDNAWTVKSDSGPNLGVTPNVVILDDSAGEKVTLDRVNKILTVEANTLKVIVKGNATVEVGGKATVSAAEAQVNVKGKAAVAAGEVSVDAKGEVSVKAAAKVRVDGSEVDINGEGGEVLTTKTQPRCYVSGIPFVGEGSVKAGK